MKLDRSAIKTLQRYPWPGNVRELKHSMERCVIMAEGPLIGPQDLNLYEQDMNHSDSFKLDEVEKKAIARVLRKCGGNHTRAAQMLDISRTTLYAKVKRYGL
jgi:DNA-binding NtrC family response regulator